MSADVFVGRVFGSRAAMVLPTIPDHAPDAIREGIARRRIVMVSGQCPCGGRIVRPNRAERRRHKPTGPVPVVGRLNVEHEPDCPAVDKTLSEAVRAWRGGTG